jgi:hypothetical protein
MAILLLVSAFIRSGQRQVTEKVSLSSMPISTGMLRLFGT